MSTPRHHQSPSPTSTTARNNNKKSKSHLELEAKITQTLRELKKEKKATRDLSERTSGVESRIHQLEKAAPLLREAQDSYYHSPTKQQQTGGNGGEQQQSRSQLSSSESMRSRSMLYDPSNTEARALSREGYRLNSASRQKSQRHLPTGPIATSAFTSITSSPRNQQQKQQQGGKIITSGRRKNNDNNNNRWNTTLNDEQGLPKYPPLNNNNNNQEQLLNESDDLQELKKSTKSLYESRRQLGASHDFPTLSTFFRYPPRDEHGFLMPSGRSSKRTAFATTHTGEHLLGASEAQVNRERMKKAEGLYLDKEKDAIAKSRAERMNQSKASGSLVQGAEGSGSDDLYPVRLAPKPTVLYTPRDSHPPGHSKTAELAVHQMPPAGKNQLQCFENGDHKFKSSKRTLYYTDYSGKRYMIDSCDMPTVHGFVLTGL